MYEYNNKQTMLMIVETLKKEGKTKVTANDIERYLPENLANRRINALRLLREMIDHRYVSANSMDGHAFVREARILNSRENLRCMDFLILLILADEAKSFDELSEELFFQAAVPACFELKCESVSAYSADQYVSDLYEAVYTSLERALYAEFIEEDSEGHFRLNASTTTDYQIFEQVTERCSCPIFRKYMRKEHAYLIEDGDYEDDDDEEDSFKIQQLFDDEDFCSLLGEDLEHFKKAILGSSDKEMETNDTSTKGIIGTDFDILDELQKRYKEDSL